MSFITFSYPLGLLGVSLIGLLYLCYLHTKKSKNKQIIPSLFFLKQITLNKITSTKTRLPFRFYLETLALVLFVFFLAEPKWSISGEGKIAIILDTSQSMGAVNSQGKSRLELAKEEIIQIQKQSNAEFKLLEIPDFDLDRENNLSDEGLSRFLTSRPGLDSLDNIRSKPFPDKMEEKLPRILKTLKSLEFSRAIFISDKELVLTGYNSDLPLQGIQVGGRENNVFISSARITEGEGGVPVVTASVGFNGTGSTRLKLEVAQIVPETILFAEKEITISGGSTSLETVELKKRPQKNSIFKVQISSSPVRDSLESDNEQYFSYSDRTEEAIKALLVTTNPALFESERKSLEIAMEGAVRSVLPDELLKFSENPNLLHIFYKIPPPRIRLEANTLVILPTESNEIVKLKKIAVTPQISSWEDNHPITRYLRLSILKPKRAIILEEPSWGKSVISAQDGPVLLSGFYNGYRLLVSGIELLPFEGDKDRLGSVLLLNILNELSKTNKNDNTDESESLLLELGSLKKIVPDSKPQERELLESPFTKGIYEGVDPVSSRKKTISVSGFYKDESNTYSRNTILLKEDSTVSESEKQLPISWYFLLAGSALLLIDLIIVLFIGREL
ncbi:MAG TPA: VWA domain-containing protein [Oligoflexia bacterium]|nr:VWA domain-containing protein [Oligoflexia bacterium]HMP48962.1 VWA domain-containing protein [Oligoflexia bacterium]